MHSRCIQKCKNTTANDTTVHKRRTASSKGRLSSRTRKKKNMLRREPEGKVIFHKHVHIPQPAMAPTLAMK